MKQSVKKSEKFTSELITILPSDSEDEILSAFEKSCKSSEETWSIFNENSECRRNSKDWKCYPKYFWEELIEYVERYNQTTSYDFKDYTCFIKGHILGETLEKILETSSEFKFLVNFGGDMILRKFSSIGLKGEKSSEILFLSDSPCVYAVFTSGNTNKRGNHIKGTRRRGTVTIIVEEPSPKDLASLDALCTIMFSERISEEEACAISKLHGYELIIHEDYE